MLEASKNNLEMAVTTVLPSLLDLRSVKQTDNSSIDIFFFIEMFPSKF